MADKTINPKVHLVPSKAYPVTIRLFSRHGHELWSKVVDKPQDGVQAVEIPGYGDTDHVPVKCVIEYADGTKVER